MRVFIDYKVYKYRSIISIQYKNCGPPIDYISGQSPIIQDAIAVIIVVGGSHLNSPVDVPSYRTLTLIS